MLDHMFGYATNGFGTRLGPANMETHLLTIRAQRESYAARHREEIRQVEQISQRALAGRRRTASAAVEETE